MKRLASGFNSAVTEMNKHSEGDSVTSSVTTHDTAGHAAENGDRRGAKPDGGFDSVLDCRNLSVSVGTGPGSRMILRDLNLTARPGQFISLVGPSGVGKTTLLRALGGLAVSDTGEVYFEGTRVRQPPEGVVVIFQNYSASLLPWRTVAKNVGLGLEGKVSHDEREQRVQDALRLVGLADRGGDRPWQLSGGMQQRVQLARGLAMRPRLLLMDEPFGALDAMTRAGLQDELQQIQQSTGCTIVFITHDIDEAVYLSDEVFALGGQPATIIKQWEVTIPRPRNQVATRELDEYLQIRHEIHEALHA